MASDSYLHSQMDADQYVSIATIAKFNLVKQLTDDLDLVVEMLRGRQLASYKLHLLAVVFCMCSQ